MPLFSKPPGITTHWSSFENPSAARNRGALTNRGAKGRAFDRLLSGSSHTLVDIRGSGVIRRIWLTVGDRGPDMLRGLSLDMWWDDCATPAVSVPLGDFFGIGLGRRTTFSCALFSDPEGRSFNCAIPMPFRRAARIELRNESGQDLRHLFYDVDLTLGDVMAENDLYFHAAWRRERPNVLGRDFTILPKVAGPGRFLGCNIGLIADARYTSSLWWGEGEVKVWFGADAHPTLVGTGLEDYIGTGWGLAAYAQPMQGCPIADGERRHWAFYRYHIDDPVWFDDACTVTVQTIGGGMKNLVKDLIAQGAPLIPVSIDPSAGMDPLVRLAEQPQPVELSDPALPDGWTNVWRQDDWSATAYFYLHTPDNGLPPLADAAERRAGLATIQDGAKKGPGEI